MNKKELIKARRENWHKYHIPNQTSMYRLKINAIFISTANSLKHELKKLEVCYNLRKQGHKFITEAERNQLDKRGNKRRVDIVDLDTGIEYEVECDKKRAERFKGQENIKVVRC